MEKTRYTAMMNKGPTPGGAGQFACENAAPYERAGV